MEFKSYDYKSRKSQVEEILDNTDEVEEVKKFPRDADFTYTNGYKAWASAVFVDLRNSTALFSKKTDVDIAKVIRGFTSEVIEILRKGADDTELKEIGIRGDCVYAIYSTPYQKDIVDIAIRATYINTYMKMLNELLQIRGLPSIKAGIGLAANEVLAVKAGRKSSGINNLVWIGETVAKASNLADLGNKNSTSAMVMSSLFYLNYIEIEKRNIPESEKWWTKVNSVEHGVYYHGNIVVTGFNDWINEGMPE